MTVISAHNDTLKSKHKVCSNNKYLQSKGKGLAASFYQVSMYSFWHFVHMDVQITEN